MFNLKGSKLSLFGSSKNLEKDIDEFVNCVKLLGPAGSGQLAKMANQICVAGVIEGVAEAIAFAEKAGLDAEKAMRVIGAGAGSSWQLVNRHQTMLADQYDHGFAVDWMRKDLDICLAEASRLGTPLPLAALVNEFYKEVQAMGGGLLTPLVDPPREADRRLADRLLVLPVVEPQGLEDALHAVAHVQRQERHRRHSCIRPILWLLVNARRRPPRSRTRLRPPRRRAGRRAH